MLRRELLDARRALRSVSEGVSGPRSKKQRGEWEMLSIQRLRCGPNQQHKTGSLGPLTGSREGLNLVERR